MSDHQTSAAHDINDKEKHRMYIGSFWLFIIAEAMIFTTLISSRFLLAGTTGSNEVNQVFGVISTLIILFSSWTIQKALRAVHERDHTTLVQNLLLTALLGFVVLILNGYEWVTMDWGSRYGEMFYITTLFHELHITGGIIALIALAVHGKQQRFSPDYFWPVKAAQLYWQFVVVVWLSVYILLYII